MKEHLTRKIDKLLSRLEANLPNETLLQLATATSDNDTVILLQLGHVRAKQFSDF